MGQERQTSRKTLDRMCEALNIRYDAINDFFEFNGDIFQFNVCWEFIRPRIVWRMLHQARWKQISR